MYRLYLHGDFVKQCLETTLELCTIIIAFCYITLLTKTPNIIIIKYEVKKGNVSS